MNFFLLCGRDWGTYVTKTKKTRMLLSKLKGKPVDAVILCEEHISEREAANLSDMSILKNKLRASGAIRDSNGITITQRDVLEITSVPEEAVISIREVAPKARILSFSQLIAESLPHGIAETIIITINKFYDVHVINIFISSRNVASLITPTNNTISSFLGFRVRQIISNYHYEEIVVAADKEAIEDCRSDKQLTEMVAGIFEQKDVIGDVDKGRENDIAELGLWVGSIDSFLKNKTVRKEIEFFTNHELIVARAAAERKRQIRNAMAAMLIMGGAAAVWGQMSIVGASTVKKYSAIQAQSSELTSSINSLQEIGAISNAIKILDDVKFYSPLAAKIYKTIPHHTFNVSGFHVDLLKTESGKWFYKFSFVARPKFKLTPVDLFEKSFPIDRIQGARYSISKKIKTAGYEIHVVGAIVPGSPSEDDGTILEQLTGEG